MHAALWQAGSELHGPPKPRRPIASDLRQEPGALAAHAGICAGGGGGARGNPPPYPAQNDAVGKEPSTAPIADVLLRHRLTISYIRQY